MGGQMLSAHIKVNLVMMTLPVMFRNLLVQFIPNENLLS